MAYIFIAVGVLLASCSTTNSPKALQGGHTTVPPLASFQGKAKPIELKQGEDAASPSSVHEEFTTQVKLPAGSEITTTVSNVPTIVKIPTQTVQVQTYTRDTTLGVAQKDTARQTAAQSQAEVAKLTQLMAGTTKLQWFGIILFICGIAVWGAQFYPPIAAFVSSSSGTCLCLGGLVLIILANIINQCSAILLDHEVAVLIFMGSIAILAVVIPAVWWIAHRHGSKSAIADMP